MWNERRAGSVAAGLALAVLVVALYVPVWGHAFVEWDDPLHVTANARVGEGLTLSNLRWALTADEAYLWHPLTWWSYLLDAELHGTERAGPWLATHVALHALNTGLVLWALLSLTAALERPGRRAACALGAALFALHPVQVESVAWVSARKELLAAGFFALTLIAYARYARRPSAPRYGAVLAWSALGAMAKGSHVALPLLLCLLDVWPLDRFAGAGERRARLARALRLCLEKLPLLALQLAAVAANFAMATEAQNVWVRDPPLATRVGAVLVNLVDTLGRLLWPAQLAIAYPNPLQPIVPAPGVAELAGACAVLLGATALAWASGPARRPLAVGGLGFAVMLLPMTGIVPIGLRSPHDRYLMVPLVALALGVGFAGLALAGGSAVRRRVLAGVVCALLVACAVQTRRQIPVWRDSDALFEHALRVTRDNAVVHYAFGTALARRGEVERALAHLEEAVSLHPDHADAHHNLGWVLLHTGRAEAGVDHLRRAVAVRPGWERARLHLALAQGQAGDAVGAMATLEQAVARAPRSADARAALGVALLRAGRREASLRALRAALALDPEHAEARRALARLEGARARTDGAR